MKHLILMRHAKAEKDAELGEDFDRALSDEGRAEAWAVAKMLKAYGLTPDFALVSKAARTQGTFAEVVRVFGDIAAEVTDMLYNAGADKLRQAVESHEDRGECVILIAHNPGLQYLALDYLFEGAASSNLMEKLRSNYPTATATVFEIDAAGRAIYDGLYLAKDAMSA